MTVITHQLLKMYSNSTKIIIFMVHIVFFYNNDCMATEEVYHIQNTGK